MVLPQHFLPLRAMFGSIAEKEPSAKRHSALAPSGLFQIVCRIAANFPRAGLVKFPIAELYLAHCLVRR